jgi:hypothetical protein
MDALRERGLVPVQREPADSVSNAKPIVLEANAPIRIGAYLSKRCSQGGASGKGRSVDFGERILISLQVTSMELPVVPQPDWGASWWRMG